MTNLGKSGRNLSALPEAEVKRRATAKDFAYAYAQQANSDLRVYDELRRLEDNIPRCHRLHYLQMAAEKACKAHLYAVQAGSLTHSFTHEVVAKVLSVWMSRSQNFSGLERQQVRKQAYEIDRLAPAVDRIGRPDNSEYPWENKRGGVTAPSSYDFPEIKDESLGFTMTLKLIRKIALEVVEEN